MMDKNTIQELIDKLSEDYIPTGVKLAEAMSQSEFERGKIAQTLEIIDSLERLITRDEEDQLA